MKLHFSKTTYPSDSRAAAYGDGCFTTMRVEASRIHHLALHLERLRAACQRLQLPEFKVEYFRSELAQYMHSQGDTIPPMAVLKVLVTISGGGRGYSRASDGALDVYVSVHDYPSHYRTWQRGGISLGVAALSLAKQPALAGVKHLNRLEQVLIKQENNNRSRDQHPSSDGISATVDELVVCDCDGMMVETATANLFWRKHKHWFTPSLDDAGVAGIVRGAIVQHLRDRHTLLNVVREPVMSLFDADEVLICNSVLGIVAVGMFSCDQRQRRFPNVQPTIQYSELST